MSKNKNRNPYGQEDVTEAVVAPTVSEDLNQIYGGRSPMINAHLQVVRNYCEAMAPGVPQTDTEGANWNMSLFNAILSIISAEDVQDFSEGMDELFMIFASNSRGALQLTYTQRFIDKMMLNEEQLNLYTSLLHIIGTFADQKSKHLYGQHFRLEGEHSPLNALPAESRERLVYYLNRQ